jgi:hypothetical protein
MRHIIPYVDNSQLFGISNPSYADSLMCESQILQRADSLIPGDILVQLEIKQLLEEGFKKVDQYHRDLIKGKNNLLEKAAHLMSDAQMTELQERIKYTIDKLKTNKVNEQSPEIVTDPKKVESEIGDVDNVMKNIESTSNLSMSDGKAGGILGMLKSLMSALTEGGSWIGIIHFCLDILGLVGDFFWNAGAIADILNGLIYMYRAMTGDSSKWILALISFAAATLPFAGTIMKQMFQVSKVGKTVAKVTTEYIGTGAAKAMSKSGKTLITDVSIKGRKLVVSDEAVELLAKAGPESSDALAYIAKTSKESLPLAKRALDAFFKDFLGLIVGWVPLIGKPLKKFFASISDMFNIFFKDSLKFADDVPKIISKSELRKVDVFFAEAAHHGSQIIREGDKLVVKRRGGTVIAELEGSILKGVGSLSPRYGPDLADRIGKEYITRTGDNILSFYEGLGKNYISITSKYGKVIKMGAATFTFSSKLTWFIGKQIAKIFVGFDSSKLSDSDYEVFGAMEIHRAMEEKRKQLMAENPGASYVIPILDPLEDPKSHGVLNGYQNNLARQLALPDLGIVAYAAGRRKDNIPQDVQDFYNFAYSDREDEADYAESQLPASRSVEKQYESNSTFKHITKFKL